MRVLHLCNRVPFPANDGGNIAMLSIADSLLSKDVEYKMLALNTRKHYVDVSGLVQKEKYNLEACTIDTSVRPLAAFANLFTSDSYNIARFDDDKFHELLSENLKEEKYDVVILESVFMAPYISTIRKHSSARVVLRAHNVEHVIWERLAVNEKNFLKRKYLNLLARRLRKYESKIIHRVDAILPITAEDEKIFLRMGARVPMHIIPVGLNMEEYDEPSGHVEPVEPHGESLNQRHGEPPSTSSGQVVEPSPPSDKPLSLFHLGAMDWLPNLEGIKWFLSNCWPIIHIAFPKLQLYLAGRGFPASLMEDAMPNVIYEGEITDAKGYMRDKQIMIVPLKSGGGMRVKIIQGMAAGKTIISTTIGAEGINYKDGENILIANTPEYYLEQIRKCLSDPAYCLSIGRNAKTSARENYSIESIGERLILLLTD